MAMGEETLETQVAVIGGGPGGYAAAFRAADLGLEVVLINAEERLGGTCLLRGCIPSKALLEVTQLINEARQAEDWGVDFGKAKIDLVALREWKNEVVDSVVSGLQTLGDERDVRLINARATFESSGELRLEGSGISHVKFGHAILATGARPIALPDMPFEKGSRIMDTANALDLADIPERLLVVGGSYMDVELGLVYAALGSKVTLVEITVGLLPGLDKDLVKPLARKAEQSFEAIYVDTKIAKIQEGKDHVKVLLEGDADVVEQDFDRVLVAVGRQPNLDEIGLENTGVDVGEDGFVTVDEQRRTADERIYAVGDITGKPMMSHKAMHEGKVAAEAIAGEPAAYDLRSVPAVIYSEPEIAWCGLMAAEAEEEGRKVETGLFPWRVAGRALTTGAGEGLTKMVFDKETQRVLGVGIVGPGAENLIFEGALAIEMGAAARDIAGTIRPHPMLSDSDPEAAGGFLGLARQILERGKKIRG